MIKNMLMARQRGPLRKGLNLQCPTGHEAALKLLNECTIPTHGFSMLFEDLVRLSGLHLSTAPNTIPASLERRGQDILWRSMIDC